MSEIDKRTLWEADIIAATVILCLILLPFCEILVIASCIKYLGGA